MIKKHWKEFTALAVLLALIIAIGIVAGVKEQERKDKDAIRAEIIDNWQSEGIVIYSITKADYIGFDGVKKAYFVNVLTRYNQYTQVIIFYDDGTTRREWK